MIHMPQRSGEPTLPDRHEFINSRRKPYFYSSVCLLITKIYLLMDKNERYTVGNGGKAISLFSP